MRTARIWGSRRIRQRVGQSLSAHKAQARFDRLLDSVACTTDMRWLRRLATLRNGTSSVQRSVVRSPLCSSIELTTTTGSPRAMSKVPCTMERNEPFACVGKILMNHSGPIWRCASRRYLTARNGEVDINTDSRYNFGTVEGEKERCAGS